MLHYAETHFRFPVSRLYRKEATILIDAPFQICPGLPCPVWLIVRKAHRFPVYIEEVYGEWKNAEGQNIPFKLPIQKKFEKPFHFEELNFENPSLSGLWMLKIFVKYKKNKIIERWNYPFLPPKPLMINFLKEEPPKPDGWLAGETHCHSSFTMDSMEFGAAPAVLQKAAKSIGLDFVCITDHSYDLRNETKFQTMKNEIAELNSAGMPLLIPGEEISCGNADEHNVHLLTFRNENYVEGHGDGGRRWWNTDPDLPIQKAIEKSGTFCFAAHPKLQMLLAEKILLKRGHWSYKDLTKNKISGIEFWNGFRGRDFYEGRKLWIKCLLSGHKLLPLGGNDAHGDLNSYTAVKKPFWSLKHNHEHVFGVVRTVLPNTGKIPFSELPENLYITDGPALWFNNFTLHAKSTEDFGIFLSITIFRGKNGFEEAEEMQINNSLSFDFEISLNNSLYVRAECETTMGKFAMTSAIFSPPAV
ncbi:MAG: hypothetical protein LBU89_08750 [Fibromonadaceae bacterium]|jgi:hypothetical protein|nr:hypothetical protein [Fibromonadaceae bacterium]